MLIYFVDNDVILKLAVYNLFWEMAACLNVKEEYIRVLPTASQYFSSRTKRIQKYRPESIRRARQVADQCKSIQITSPNSEYQLLLNEQGIDAGEALLVAATQNEENFYLLTGDKRFLKALTASNLTDVKRRLSKKIICLEQLMLYIITTSEFDKVCRRVLAAEFCDQIITEAFGCSSPPKQQTVVKNLNQAVENLRVQTGDLLVEYVSCLRP